MTEILNHFTFWQWVGIIILLGAAVYLGRILVYWSFLISITVLLMFIAILAIILYKLYEFLYNLITRKK